MTQWFTRSIVLFVLFAGLTSGVATAADRLRETIDRHIAAAWKANTITPAEPATDAEFLRRVTLDLLGRIPTSEETVAFLNDSASNKREKLIDRLLEHPRFAVHQADVWDMVYFGRNPPGFGTRDRDGFKQWLQKQFADNVPYNEWVRELLIAEGNSAEHGPPMFYVQYKNRPEDAAVAITQKFLGVQLQCARCHDHPFDSWSQKDFYGVAAFFARLEVVSLGKKNKQKAYAIGEKNTGEILFSGPASEQSPGKKGTPVSPKFPDGKVLEEPELPEDFKEPRRFPSGTMPPKPKFSRKGAFAKWATDADNPYFARAAANRIWAQFLGKGIVHPVDNLSETNPPSHPELLDALSNALVDHNFDLKWFIREIVNSKTYQLSSAGDVTDAKPVWYQRARVRPLSAEELFESWIVATGYDDALKAAGKKRDGRFDVRAVTWSYVRRFFGSPTDGVGNFQGGMHEHLYLNNGQVHSLITRDKGGLYDVITHSEQPWEKRVERLFLQVLSRRPTPEETKTFAAYLSAEDDADDRLHEAIWTLMTCSEFRFNH